MKPFWKFKLFRKPTDHKKRRIRWKHVLPLCAVLAAVIIVAVVAVQSINHAFQKSPTKLQASVHIVSSKAEAVSSAADTSSAANSGSTISGDAPAGVKVAYLTFDDGPSAYTPQLLNILQQNNIKATFFIAFMGQNTLQKRQWLQQEVTDGETVGIHSWTHNYAYIYSSEQNFLTDFTTMRNIIVSTTGIDPKICRFPGGVGNTVSLKYHQNTPIMPTLVTDVQNMGVKPFDWTAGGEDAEFPRPANGEQFASKVMTDIGSSEHPIILMHDRYQVSIDAVPILIKQLRAKGYSFSTLSANMTAVTEKSVLSRRSSK